MIYGVILAGGNGSRMGSVEKPKQFIEISGKPIIIHTMEKFFVHNKFDKLLVLCPKQWIENTKSLIARHFAKGIERIVVLEGGSTRNETILNAIDFIEQEDGLDEETLLVTHDAVRPFVTYRIIEENIEYGKKYGVVDTVIQATDTIVYSEGGDTITNVPNRAKMYQGQTPQTFNAAKFRELYGLLSEEEKACLTDASKIFVLKGESVYLVQGEVYNIKITYPYDLRVAESLVQQEDDAYPDIAVRT